jgi:chloride channel 7
VEEPHNDQLLKPEHLEKLLKSERIRLKSKIQSQAYVNDWRGVAAQKRLLKCNPKDAMEDDDGCQAIEWYLGKVLPMKWAICVLIAIAIALEAGVVILGPAKVIHWKLDLITRFCNEGPVGYGYSFATLLLYSLPATLVAAFMVTYYAPHASGSGIPEVKACLNGMLMPQAFTFKTWFARSFGLILVTSSGLYAGTEGPFAHLGGIIGAGFAQGLPCLARWWPAVLTGHRNRCEFIAQGAAMGVAAAFGAPVGGILFSLEEASSFWTRHITWRAFLGTMIAAVLAKMAKHGFTKFSVNGFIEFPDKTADFEVWELAPFVGLGLATGLVGAFFCTLVQRILTARRRIFRLGNPTKTTQLARLAEVFCVTSLTMAVIFWVPVLVGCRELPLDTNGRDGPKLTGTICDEGQYSDIAFILLQPKEDAIKALFSRDMADGAYLSTANLLGCFMIVFTLTLATFGCAIPVGLFIPNILSGACLGRAVGQLLADSGMKVRPDVYALMGAAGSLAGFSRMTISLAVIFLEITNNVYLLLPLMLVIMTSKLVGDRFGLSVYDIVLELNPDIHLLEDGLGEDHQLVLEGLTAHDVCTAEVVVLMPTEPQVNIVRVLVGTAFGNYPIVDSKDRFLGTVSRADLIMALDVPNAPTSLRSSWGKSAVDLVPFLSAGSPITTARMPAARAFEHFRNCGLQHLCIVDHDHQLAGILTRTDMARLCRHGAHGVEEVRTLIHRKHAAVCAGVVVANGLSSHPLGFGHHENACTPDEVPSTGTSGSEVEGQVLDVDAIHL